jgi:alcohol dehydrogenase class IV
VAGSKLLEELRALNQELGVPSPARYGIKPEAWAAVLPTMAQQALASGSPANNPRVPTAEEIVGLYRRAYG